MSEITIKQGHLKPTSSKEVIIEDGDWEVSVWVNGGKLEIIVVNSEDKPIKVTDNDTGEKYSVGYTRTEMSLCFKSGR